MDKNFVKKIIKTFHCEVWSMVAKCEIAFPRKLQYYTLSLSLGHLLSFHCAVVCDHATIQRE